jgi:hypothetical protein
MADTLQPHAALPTAADVDAAASRLAGVALRTAADFVARARRGGGRGWFLKAETLQRTGSFKFRGAYNKLSSIPEDRRAAASWPIPPAITRRAWRRRRSSSACRRDRDAVGRAAAEARAHRRARRRGRAL